MTNVLDERTGTVDRFSAPLYTITEAARYLGVPTSTMATWTHGVRAATTSGKRPAIAALPRTAARGPVISFIGLAEGLVLAATRARGVSLQRLRPALKALKEELGLKHVLANRLLGTDGADILYEYSQSGSDAAAAGAARRLVAVRNGRPVLDEVVAAYLRRMEYADDGYARLIRLPAYETAEIVVDPERGFGQPIFARGGARLEDVLDLFQAGEPLAVVAEEYGVPEDHLEDALRIATRAAA